MLGYGAALVEQWTQFLTGLLTPSVLLFAICTASLTWASIETSNKNLTLYLAIAATLSASLLGSRVERLLGQHSDQLVLRARGVGDLRNLHMLANSISALEGRLRQHLSATRATTCSQDRFEGWFEEAVQTCCHLHGLVANAIDSWKDIIPTADVPLQINKIVVLERAVEEKAAQEEDLKAKLTEAQQLSQETGALREQLAAKQQELARTEKELKRAKEQLAEGLSYSPPLTLADGHWIGPSRYIGYSMFDPPGTKLSDGFSVQPNRGLYVNPQSSQLFHADIEEVPRVKTPDSSTPEKSAE